MFKCSQKASLRICVGLSFLSSLGGLGYAIFWGTACDGGRGGAVAVAIAFGVLFAARQLPKDYIEARDSKGVAQFDSLPIEKRVSRLRSALAVMLDREKHESVALVLASVSGTLIWGFGDIIAACLGAAPC